MSNGPKPGFTNMLLVVFIVLFVVVGFMAFYYFGKSQALTNSASANSQMAETAIVKDDSIPEERNNNALLAAPPETPVEPTVEPPAAEAQESNAAPEPAVSLPLKMENAVDIGNGFDTVAFYALTDNFNHKYVNSMGCGSGWSKNEFLTLLDGKYAKFKGTAYVFSGYSVDSTTDFIIELDGVIIYSSPEITKTTKPIPLDLDITGGNEFLLKITGNEADMVKFGDCVFTN